MAFLRRLAVRSGATLLYLVNQSIGRRLTFRLAYHPETEVLIRQGRPVLYALWHGDSFLALYTKQHTGAAILASSAIWRGDVFSGWAKRLGFEVINIPGFGEGKKWLAGSIKMLRALAKGKEGAVVVDGPTGPYHEVKPGVFFLSQRSGVPIVPVGVAVSKAIRFFWRWDKYLLPRPGARAVLYGGAPRYLDKNAKLNEIPEIARQLAEAIDESGRQAHKILKHSQPDEFAPIAPGPRPKPGTKVGQQSDQHHQPSGGHHHHG